MGFQLVLMVVSMGFHGGLNEISMVFMVVSMGFQ